MYSNRYDFKITIKIFLFFFYVFINFDMRNPKMKNLVI